jgi:hypothetical protein
MVRRESSPRAITDGAENPRQEERVVGDTSAGAGISEAYDATRRYVESALALREALLQQVLQKQVGEYGKVGRWLRAPVLMTVTRLAFRQALTSARAMQPSDVEEMQEVATEEQKAQSGFAQVTAIYWIEELAHECRSRFALDAARLASFVRIAAMRAKPTPVAKFRSSPQRVIVGAALVLGLFSVVINKDSFHALGWSADAYGYVTVGFAAVIVAITVYLGVLGYVVRDRPVTRLCLRAEEVLNGVLSYCEIEYLR